MPTDEWAQQKVTKTTLNNNPETYSLEHGNSPL